MKTEKYTVILLLITIEVHSSYSLLFAPKDGEDGDDGNGLNLKKLASFIELRLETAFS